ncbi:MAG TPA: response regulator [Noviherbaspirillum sp.]|nr:response regulator [Noviherbaspirillum sp.]
MDISVKPRVLIADDSRIVRATLIKHIEGMFEFREALDGEQAWETLLIDPSIRVVITDLAMPKLDGYGLLQRIRSSKISRIREIPVVVVSGSDENEERERVIAAGATDLITKGMDTAQLLSRLDILSSLIATQREFERTLEALVQDASTGSELPLPPAETLNAYAEALLTNALKNKKNFVVLGVCVGLKHNGLQGVASAPPARVIDAIGQLLRRTVRQTDHVAKSGEAEFMLITGGINFDAARTFAHRICRAIASVHLVKSERMSFIASCGLASLSDVDIKGGPPNHEAMLAAAHRRALMGLSSGITGVIGGEEEAALRRGEKLPSTCEVKDAAGIASPELSRLVQLIREGREEEVSSYLSNLPAELRTLVDLALQQNKH